MRSERPTLRGDEAQLFERHFKPLVRQVKRDAGVPEAVAEDCASFAFLQLCRRQPERFQTGGWLRVVARHEAFAWQRQARRLRPLDPRPAGQAGERVRISPARRSSLSPPSTSSSRSRRARPYARSPRSASDSAATLALQVAGYSYREIQTLRGVTYTNVNRHVTEGRAAARRLRDAA